MVVEQAETLVKRIEQLERLRRAVDVARVVKERADRTEELADDLKKNRDIAVALRERDCALEIPVEEAAHVHADFAKVQADTLEGDAPLLDPDRLREPLALLAKLVSILKSQCTSAWREYSERQAVNVDDNILEALGRVPSLSKKVTKIRELQLQYIELARQVMPDDVSVIEELDKVAASLRDVWGSFRGEGGVPERIIDFLIAAGGEGVPLDQLSDDVRKWLVDQQIEGKFRIVAGS